MLKVAGTSLTRLPAGWRMLEVLQILAKVSVCSVTFNKTCDIWHLSLMCLLMLLWSAFTPPLFCSLWGRPKGIARTVIVNHFCLVHITGIENVWDIMDSKTVKPVLKRPPWWEIIPLLEPLSYPIFSYFHTWNPDPGQLLFYNHFFWTFSSIFPCKWTPNEGPHLLT